MSTYSELLLSLTEEEYAALKADIAKRGQQVPIELDEDGNVLDGAHRLLACRELGREPLTVVRRGLSEAEKREHAIKQNLARRQIGPVGWGVAFAALLEVRGIKQGQGQRNDRTSATVAEVAAELGVSERTARNRMSLARKLDRHPDLIISVDKGAMPHDEARREAAHREAPEAPEEFQLQPAVKIPRWVPSKARALELAEIPDALAAHDRAQEASDAIRIPRGLTPVLPSLSIIEWRRRLAEAEAEPTTGQQLEAVISRIKQIRAGAQDGRMRAALGDAISTLEEAQASEGASAAEPPPVPLALSRNGDGSAT